MKHLILLQNLITHVNTVLNIAGQGKNYFNKNGFNIKQNVAEIKCTFQEWFALKHGKINVHCVRMYTLLLDNCIFEYSVLYFPAPCGLEVMAGKCILHIDEKFRIVNRQTKKETNAGRSSTTDSQRST